MMNTPPPLTLDSTVVATKRQISRDLAGETVILDLKGGVYHGLNATGARIWQLIQQPCIVSAIRDTIMREYDVDAPQCEKHLLTLLNQLAGKGLLEVLPKPLA
jgi:hypothetical protein